MNSTPAKEFMAVPLISILIFAGFVAAGVVKLATTQTWDGIASLLLRI